MTVNVYKVDNKNYNIEFVNKSRRIPKNLNIFKTGAKVDETSKGFGYGLYWIKTLENSYNTLNENCDSKKLEIIHEQIGTDPNFAFQKFTIKNINLKTK